MFIEVVRSGGVAGMIRRARVDIDSLDDAAAVREWHHLVAEAKPLLDSHLDSPPPNDERDAFVWTVSVGDTTCQLGDSSVSGPLRTLAQRTLREGRTP